MDSDDGLISVDAYVAFLKRKQLECALIEQRQHFVEMVARRLHGKPRTREAYAETLRGLMHQPKHQAWLYDVTVAREFYPFWMHDIKAIASLSEQYGIDVNTIAWRPLPATLQALVEMAENTRFSEVESVLLERYLQGLKHGGLERRHILVRLKLAKLLLLRLRDAPKGINVVYRIAVDMTLPVFRYKKTRQLFLVVVREFFYYWMQTDYKY